jgi:hypothetical protein
MKRIIISAISVVALFACSPIPKTEFHTAEASQTRKISALEPHQLHSWTVSKASGDTVYFGLKNALEVSGFTTQSVVEDHTVLSAVGRTGTEFTDIDVSAKIIPKGDKVNVMIYTSSSSEDISNQIHKSLKDGLDDYIEMGNQFKLPK